MVKWKKYDADILLTTACPVECEFCIYSCSPNGEWMPEKTISRTARELTSNDFGIRICGGEPFYDMQKLEKCLDIVLRHQAPEQVLVITSAFFAADSTKLAEAVKLLRRKKLDTVVISTDRFHLPIVPLSAVERAGTAFSEAGMKVIIRLSMDEQSLELIDRVVELVVRHSFRIEPHASYGLYGKAELLDPCLIDNPKARTQYMNEAFEIQGAAPGDFKEQSPKRSQRAFAAKFYPTVFPNGNTYADTQCCKGSFMGNINEKPLKSMIDDFSGTLPGSILWSENSDCEKRMAKLNPVPDHCDYCRNQPLTENMPEEAIGRQYVVADPDNLPHINTKREILLAFDLKEKHLNRAAGKEIMQFLKSLEGRRFVISRPLPRCIAGPDYADFLEKYNAPADCMSCRELFSANDNTIRSCTYLGEKGPKLHETTDRRQIFELFNSLRLSRQPSKTCRACHYFRRRQCDGLCFRGYSKN